MLTVTALSVASSTVLRIAEQIQGSTEALPCSGRGLCNAITGFCECFYGFGPSDGNGASGLIPDCGHMSIAATDCPSCT